MCQSLWRLLYELKTWKSPYWPAVICIQVSFGACVTEVFLTQFHGRWIILKVWTPLKILHLCKLFLIVYSELNRISNQQGINLLITKVCFGFLICFASMRRKIHWDKITVLEHQWVSYCMCTIAHDDISFCCQWEPRHSAQRQRTTQWIQYGMKCLR